MADSGGDAFLVRQNSNSEDQETTPDETTRTAEVARATPDETTRTTEVARATPDETTRTTDVTMTGIASNVISTGGGPVVVHIPQGNRAPVQLGSHMTANYSYNYSGAAITCKQLVHHHQPHEQQHTHNTVIYNNCYYGNHPGRPDPVMGGEESRESSDTARVHYVHTPDLDEAADILEELHLVVLCGPPGSGKTTLARALLHMYQDKGYRPCTIAHVHEVRGCIEEGGRSVVLMDGVLGEVRVSRVEYKALRSLLPVLIDCMRSGNCLIVLTVYPHVLGELSALETRSCTPLLQSTCIVHVLTTPLHPDVKTAMVTSHLQELQLSTAEQVALVAMILRKDCSGAAFPWCCRQLVHYWLSLNDPTVFFDAPVEALVPLLQRMLRDPEHGKTIAAVTSLTMLGLGQFLHYPGRVQPQLETLGLHLFSDYQLEQYADVLKGSILNDNGLGFHSRVIYDAVGLALGRSFSLPVLLKVCDVTFLVQHVRTVETEEEFSVTIGPSPAERHLLIQAIYEHLVNSRLPEVCQHPAFHCPQFLAEFEAFCRDNKNYLQRVLSAVDPVHKMPLLYWSVWGPSGNLIEWCLKITKKQITTDTNVFTKAAITANLLCQKSRLFRELLETVSPKKTFCTEFDIPLPSMTQRITEDLRKKTAMLILDIESSTAHVLYLSDPQLPVPGCLIKLSTTGTADGDKVHVVIDNIHKMLALRLVSDRQVDERDEDGNTLLHVAAHTGHLDAVKMAVKSGASLIATNKRGLTPTQLAANRITRDRKKAESQGHNEGDIHKACGDGDLDKVKVMLCMEATLQDKYGEFSESPLHAAAGAGQTVGLLISLNADVNVKNAKRSTPLHHACMAGHTQTALLLIRHFADVNVKNARGRTPLHLACMAGHTQTALLLIQHHANVNVKDARGSTPLHITCAHGHTQTALLLIQHHAIVNVKDARGSTPLHDACMVGQTQTAGLLIDQHADVNVKDKTGYTPLDDACMNGHTQTAALLILHHAHINVHKEEVYATPALALASQKTSVAQIQLTVNVNNFRIYQKKLTPRGIQ